MSEKQNPTSFLTRALADGHAKLTGYYHPGRVLAIRALAAASDRVLCKPLSDIVSFERAQVKSPGDNYLSLGHVQSNTGELVPSDADAEG